MSFDEDARLSAAAVAAHLGREVQDRIQVLVHDLLASAAQERQSLTNQAQQAVWAAEETLQASIARAREEAATEATARIDAERATRETDLADARQQERHTLLAGLDRVVQAFRQFDEAATLSQLLDVLAASAAREASRCAVFVVRGRALQGWSFSGYTNAPSDPKLVMMAFEAVPELARVAETGAPTEIHSTAVATSGPLAFVAATHAGRGVAVPVTVGGHVAAVVYGDDGGSSDRSEPSVWPQTLELLARHAARCLESQTAIRAARLPNRTPASSNVLRPMFGSNGTESSDSPQPQADAVTDEARLTARQLLGDIRQAHNAIWQLGRDSRDLARRLQPEIARARRLFEERVPYRVDRDRIFDEELVRTLADGNAELLGDVEAASSTFGGVAAS